MSITLLYRRDGKHVLYVQQPATGTARFLLLLQIENVNIRYGGVNGNKSLQHYTDMNE